MNQNKKWVIPAMAAAVPILLSPMDAQAADAIPIEPDTQIIADAASQASEMASGPFDTSEAITAPEPAKSIVPAETEETKESGEILEAAAEVIVKETEAAEEDFEETETTETLAKETEAAKVPATGSEAEATKVQTTGLQAEAAKVQTTGLQAGATETAKNVEVTTVPTQAANAAAASTSTEQIAESAETAQKDAKAEVTGKAGETAAAEETETAGEIEDEDETAALADAAEIMELAETSAYPSYQQAYERMMKLQTEYPEGMDWDNYKPYGKDGDKGTAYQWKGGLLPGNVDRGVGCAAFAFLLSDAAFDNLPATMINRGNFEFKDVKVGDILRLNGGAHTVIVLQKNDSGVIIAEGNYNKTVHWGRVLTAAEVAAADSLVTRYPENYVDPSADNADDIVEDGEGTEKNGLNWTLTQSGVLTISGNGSLTGYSESIRPSWENAHKESIHTIVIKEGITGIGNYAFYQSKAISVYLPGSITSIGQSAFQESDIISVTIPKSVDSIGDDAFRKCAKLVSVSVSEGVKTIGENAFRGCMELRYIDFPASITSVGAGAFMECSRMVRVRFAPGTGNVYIGDNLFSRCWYLTDVTLPSKANRISAGMFESCTLLSSLYIPKTVTEIGNLPFAESGVESISFGGTKAQWESLITAYNRLPDGITVSFDVDFEDPFATDPNAPSDLIVNPDYANQGSSNGSSGNSGNTGSSGSTGSIGSIGNTGSSNNTNGSTDSNSKPGENKPVYTPPSNDSNQPNSYLPGSNWTAEAVLGNSQPGYYDVVLETRPDTGTPFIKGENGMTGWDVIRSQEKTAAKNSVINVDMNGVSLVPWDIFDSIKGQDVTITFDMGNGIQWIVDGKSITTDQAGDIDLSVKTGTDIIPADLVNKAAGGNYSFQFSLAHKGEFGFTPVLSINLGKENAGRAVSLYYYNPETKTLELVSKEKMEEDGTVKLTLTQGADYLIVVDDDSIGSESVSTAPGRQIAQAAMPKAEAQDKGSLWRKILAAVTAIFTGSSI